MSVSIVIITRDEAPRLRLVLHSLVPNATTAGFEVVVVNDGSTDATRDVITELESQLPLRAVHHEQSRGRSAARNVGGRTASGDVLVFLDGDCVAAPGLAMAHELAHRLSSDRVSASGIEPIIGRGETFHLRCTRFFRDPERGIPFPDHEARIARMAQTELERALVTTAQVRERFDDIVSRAEPGIYPGAAPRRLFELEMRALRGDPGSSVLWMAVAAQNLSLPRRAFLEVGGFDERITINEHRELALRLCERGARVVPVEGARTYHLTHRSGWRDPLTADPDWELAFYEAHPSLACKLMLIFWQSLADDPHIPEVARIRSLEQLDAIVREGSPVDYDQIRREHPSMRVLGHGEATVSR